MPTSKQADMAQLPWPAGACCGRHLLQVKIALQKKGEMKTAAHRLVVDMEGTPPQAKGSIHRDTLPGMCTCQAREQGLQQQMTEL